MLLDSARIAVTARYTAARQKAPGETLFRALAVNGHRDHLLFRNKLTSLARRSEVGGRAVTGGACAVGRDSVMEASVETRLQGSSSEHLKGKNYASGCYKLELASCRRS